MLRLSITKKQLYLQTINNLFSTNSSAGPSHLNTLSLSLNNYLKQNLIKNHIYELKQFQYQTFKNSNQGFNCFLNSCTGSGKTLAYLLPILNNLMNKVQQNRSQQQQNNNGTRKDLQHGAIILTLNKQLCLQIYKTIRMLDPLQLLSVKRTGPISHYSPVVNLLSNPPKKEQQANIIDAKINNNLVNTIKWSNTDILISTPQLLYNIIDMSQSRNSKDFVRPQFIAVDQADLLLQIDKNVSRNTFKIIQQVNNNLKTNKKQLQEGVQYKKLQYVLACSSFPKKMAKFNHLEALNMKFPGIKQIKGQRQHEIPLLIDLFSIQIAKMPNNKLFYVKDILKSRLNQRIIIFCNKKNSTQQVSYLVRQQLKLTCDVYHAGLDSNERSRVLNRFEKGDNSILISTDLGSRGLDFTMPVNLIIQYDMADNVTGFINRAGRVGRNNVKGQVITMVQPQNEQLFKHIQALVSQNQKLDKVFSRKRSYNKLYKQKQN